jgi:exodeoxyribonuclease V gamma subunit
VRAFLRQRLGISLRDYSHDVADALPVELDPLEASGVGRRLLRGTLAGDGLDASVAAEIARGTLPPGRLAIPVIDRVRPVVEEIAGHARCALGTAAPESVDVKVVLPDGRSLSGTVPGLYGDVLGSAAYSRVHPRHRIAGWVRLLALTTAYPDRGFSAVTIGRARSGADDGTSATIARIPPVNRDAALADLATLVDLWDRGMREPLPLACAASAAYAAAARDGRNAVAAGEREWESGWKFPKEDADLEHQLAFGGVLTFAELLDEPPRADEAGDGWEASETTRFGRLSRRLWDGLLAGERLDDQ